MFIYPGPANTLDAFRQAYAEYLEEGEPEGTILYDTDLALATLTGLEGDLAIPATLVIDEQGIVRWAYVAEPGNPEDRPSVARLLEVLEDELPRP
jgi:hypothetical protein